MSKYSQQLVCIGLIVSFSIGCDQTTKRLAEHALDHTSYSLFFDTIRLQLIKNSGAFLSFGSHFSDKAKLWVFIIIPLIVLMGALIVILLSKLELIQKIMIALIISGGMGNLIDRIMLSGQVTDFINIGIGFLRTGIFNIADVAIMAGALGLVAIEISKMKQPSIKKNL